MSDRLAELEARVAELESRLGEVRERVGVLERGAPARRRVARGAGAAPSVKAGEELAAATRSVAFVGRTLLVLAGAFLLRALTDGGTLPAWLGAGAGFVYAGAWVLAADRAGAARPWSAGFHGLAAVLVAFPLLFETVTRFRLLSPALALTALGGFTGVALAVAARRRLEALAWIVSLGGAATAVALAIATGRLGPAALYLVLLGVAALWLGYVVDWFGLRWPIAIAADLAVAALALRATAPGAAEGIATAAVLQVALMALYLGSIATRTLLLGRQVVAFEVVQTCGALAAGLGGAALVAARAGAGSALGLACLLFAAAGYAVGFAFLGRRRDGGANFHFYTSIAIVFALSGSALLLSGAALPVAWALVAVLAAVLARRTGRLTLATHACVYAVAAGLAADALAAAARAVFGAPAAAAVAPPWTTVLVAAGIAAAAWLEADAIPERPALRDRVPRLVLLCALAVAWIGIASSGLAVLLARDAAGGADPGAIATVRTAVLVAAAIAAAALGRRAGWREAGWLAYPILAVVGLKLVVEDVARSRPATLFVAFALYGAALLLVPRLRRRERVSAAAPDGPIAPGA
jgi:hypothetical protein